jgi:hypothetical protein
MKAAKLLNKQAILDDLREGGFFTIEKLDMLDWPHPLSIWKWLVKRLDMLETDLILGSFLPHSEFDGVIYLLLLLLLLLKLNSCKRHRSRSHIQKVEKFRWWFLVVL